jgi:hypothetical protein
MTLLRATRRNSRLSDTGPFEKERQSGRVVMRFPVEIRGATEDGKPLEEQTFTGMVGAMGAMILTSCKMAVGAEVELTNRFSHQTAKFRVAWVRQQEEGSLWETGLESLKPLDDFWGVRFPPKPPHP